MKGSLLGLFLILGLMGLLAISDYRANRGEKPSQVQTGLKSISANRIGISRFFHRASFAIFSITALLSLRFLFLAGYGGLMAFLTLPLAAFAGLVCALMSWVLIVKFKTGSAFDFWSGVIAFVLSIGPAVMTIAYVIRHGI